MSQLKQKFLRYVCQTSTEPLGIEVVKASGPYLYTPNGKKYLDLLAGIGVVNIGHGRKEILQAIETQAKRYLHAGVYGELVLEPQVKYAERLAQELPGQIDQVYFANSGAEAVEGALKLARKYSGRRKIFSFEGCYHGDTFGALSCQSHEIYRKPYLPLVPDIYALPWNRMDALDQIDAQTAGVIIEPIQGEGGVRRPDEEFMQALQQRCRSTGALLILDEVMTGFGRTGKLFAAEHWDLEPDVVVMAKALGGGLPLGAFAGPAHIMQTLSQNPPLAHVTTFGGHPLSCAAGLASLEIILTEDLPKQAVTTGEKLLAHLQQLQQQSSAIAEVRGYGAFLAIEFIHEQACRKFTRACFNKGVILGWTLHRAEVVRLSPPLHLTEDQISAACDIMQQALQEV